VVAVTVAVSSTEDAQYRPSLHSYDRSYGFPGVMNDVYAGDLPYSNLQLTHAVADDL
jgi:hypothetical protein